MSSNGAQTAINKMSLQQALKYEAEHKPEPGKKPWTIKDALRWEAERAKWGRK